MFLLLLESRTGGFTYHEKIPAISTIQINPVEDDEIIIDTVKIESAHLDVCPITVVMPY